jgi:hypothetical protein
MQYRRIAAAAAALCLAAPASAAATVPPAELAASVSSGTAWIRSQQDPATGALTGFGADWAATGLAAAGVHAADVKTTGPSLQDALLAEWTSEGWTYPTVFSELGNPPGWLVATDFERAILIAHAAGLQPTRLSANANLVAQLAGLYQPNGAFGAPGLFNGTVFGVLALSRTAVPQGILDQGTKIIRDTVHDDGGWTFQLATTPAQKAQPSDIDMTGAAVAALCDGGVSATDPVVTGALAFLRGKLDNATGAFNAMFGANADSNAWAVQGLNACGIDPQSAEWTTAAGKTPLDYLVALQRKTGPHAGSFKYMADEGDDFPNLYSSQDAVRALAGGSLTADPPGGRLRPGADVPAGTPVPTVLALDDGADGLKLCRTTAPVGAPVNDVLTAAQAESMPPGCVTELALDGDTIVSVNGKAGGWLASLDGKSETLAAAQPVGFGDIVALRRSDAPLPAGTVDAGSALAFGTQAQGTIGGAQSVTFTARDYPVRPTRADVDGDDFLISGDSCTGEILQPGEQCTVRVRFAPTIAGERPGTLILHGGAAPATAGLSGTGTITAPAGTTGPKGDTGPKGERGPRGASAKVTCKTVGKARKRVSCTLKANRTAKLTRHGKVYARGKTTALRATRRVPAGRYTLRVGTLRIPIALR